MINKKIQYYSLNNILQHEGQYYIIFGSRSNGKSYAVDKLCLDNYYTKGEEFVICKRYGEDIKTSICSSMLTPLYDYVLNTYGYYIRYYQGKWLTSQDETLPINQWQVMGYSQSLNNVDRYKGSQYPKVTTIVFEEFMAMRGDYLANEVNLFINLVSTIVRKRSNVRVFLLGNTITKYSPYSEALGIKLERLKVGEIIEKTIKYKNSKTTFILERTKNVKITDNGTEDSVYTNFGKNVNKMINDGSFECSQYPRIRNGVHFNINEREIRNSGEIVNKRLRFNKADKTNMLFEFNDNFYRLYLNSKTNNIVCGITPIEGNLTLTRKNLFVGNPGNNYIIINPSRYYTNSISVYNVARYNGYPHVNRLLDLFTQAYYNNCIVYTSDEVGEDIVTLLRICGI